MTSPPSPPSAAEEVRALEVPAVAEEAPALIGRRQRSGNLLGSVATFLQARRDGLWTTLFAAGIFCAILFVFLPVIDQGKIARAQARVKDESAGPDGAARVGSKALEQAQKEWKDAETNAQMARYWYDWGLLFGFLLLAGGSLGFLGSPNSQIKRVLGCIVLAGQILLVFLIIVVGRSSK